MAAPQAEIAVQRREVRPYALDLERAQRTARRRAILTTAAWWLAAIALACAWDRAAWLMATGGPGVRADQRLLWLEAVVYWEGFKAAMDQASQWEARGIGRALLALLYATTYLFGRIWPWIGLALILIFRHWAGTDGAKVKRGLRCGVLVLLTPGLAGLLAEGVKILSRRMRPEFGDGWWRFKPLTGDIWNVSGLGLASSHAAVAVGGALAASAILPRWRAVLWVLAALCVIGRVAVGAHYVSDVVVGAAIGYWAWRGVYAWDRQNNGGIGVDRSDLV